MKKIVTALILVICFVGVAVVAFNVGHSQGFKTGYDYVIQNQYVSYDEVSHERVIFQIVVLMFMINSIMLSVLNGKRGNIKHEEMGYLIRITTLQRMVQYKRWFSHLFLEK